MVVPSEASFVYNVNSSAGFAGFTVNTTSYWIDALGIIKDNGENTYYGTGVAVGGYMGDSRCDRDLRMAGIYGSLYGGTRLTAVGAFCRFKGRWG